MPNEPPIFDDDTAEILNQSDIDALMAEAMTDEEAIVFNYKGERFDPDAKVHVESYDFRNPVFLTEIELRQVRIQHDHFIHYLAARLSMFLRMDFSLKMSQIYTAPYQKFTEQIPNPTYISLFRLEELSGVGVIDINPRLAMTMVDRLLGGRGQGVVDERYLTEIEMALMDDILFIILEEWCRQWEETRELNATLIGRENNGRFLQTSPHDAIILVLTMEATVGDCSEPMQIGIPYYTIEPVIREMQENAKRFNRTANVRKEKRYYPAFDEIGVPLTAEWDAFETTVSDLVHLRPGDVIQLPRDILAETVVRLEDAPRFRGEVGLEGENVAVRITDDLSKVRP